MHYTHSSEILLDCIISVDKKYHLQIFLKNVQLQGKKGKLICLSY